MTDWRDFGGVNIHTQFDDGAYIDDTGPRGTLAMLREIGFRHVRDWAPNPGRWPERYGRVSALGVRWCLGPANIHATPEDMLGAIKAVFPSADNIEYLEGPNELNNQPNFQYKGQWGPAAGPQWMADLRALVNADPFFAGKVKLVGLSSWPLIGVDCDVSGLHLYPGPGVDVAQNIAGGVAAQTALDRVGRAAITEIGFKFQEFSEDEQASLTLQSLRAASMIPGVERAYLYELREGYAANHLASGFGLYGLDGSPREVVKALKTLFGTAAPAPAPPGPAPAYGPTLDKLYKDLNEAENALGRAMTSVKKLKLQLGK